MQAQCRVIVDFSQVCIMAILQARAMVSPGRGTVAAVALAGPLSWKTVKVSFEMTVKCGR